MRHERGTAERVRVAPGAVPAALEEAPRPARVAVPGVDALRVADLETYREALEEDGWCPP